MRLYPKRLRSIEDLEREKKLLLREKELLDKDEFLSADGLLGKSKKGGKEKGGDSEWQLIDMLPVSNPVVKLVIKKVLQRFTAKQGNAEKTEAATPPGENKPHKSWLRKSAAEFIGGYLKWKAIELSYNGIKHILKKRKEK